MDNKEISNVIAEAAQAAGTAAKVVFTQKQAPPPADFVYEYATIPTGNCASKIVVHFLNVGPRAREGLSRALRALVASMDIPDTKASAGDNVVFPNNWDFVMYNVPDLRCPYVLSRIIDTVETAVD